MINNCFALFIVYLRMLFCTALYASYLLRIQTEDGQVCDVLCEASGSTVVNCTTLQSVSASQLSVAQLGAVAPSVFTSCPTSLNVNGYNQSQLTTVAGLAVQVRTASSLDSC